MLWLFHKLKISNLSQSAFVTKSLSQAGFKWMDSGVGVLDIVGLPTTNHLKGTLARFINAVLFRQRNGVQAGKTVVVRATKKIYFCDYFSNCHNIMLMMYKERAGRNDPWIVCEG